MGKIVLDLSGYQGNAFFILEIMKRYFEVRAFPEEFQKEFFDKVRSGDYNNLLDVSQEYCPEIVYKNRV